MYSAPVSASVQYKATPLSRQENNCTEKNPTKSGETITTSTMNRDRFSALPVNIRHHILTYLESEFVKRDQHGNVCYIGPARLGMCIKAEVIEQEVRSRQRHRFAQVSRQFREDFFDLFFSLNKFEFGSGPKLLGFLRFLSRDQRLERLTSLRFTAREHANVPQDHDPGKAIECMRRIFELLFSCVNLKELEIRAQIYRSQHGMAQSFTFPVKDALSRFQGTSLNESAISFGDLIENAPRRYGYDEDPRKRLQLYLPWDTSSQYERFQSVRGKYERVQGILASAYDIVLKERLGQERQEQPRQEPESR